MLLAGTPQAASRLIQLVQRQFAVPVKVEVCVPAASVTEIVADFAPVVVSLVRGWNATVTTQLAPGAKVV